MRCYTEIVEILAFVIGFIVVERIMYVEFDLVFPVEVGKCIGSEANVFYIPTTGIYDQVIATKVYIVTSSKAELEILVEFVLLVDVEIGVKTILPIDVDRLRYLCSVRIDYAAARYAIVAKGAIQVSADV